MNGGGHCIRSDCYFERDQYALSSCLSRGIAACLTLKIALRVAPRSRRRLIRTVVATKTLYRGPGIDQRAIHRKMLNGKQARNRQIAHHGQQKANRTSPFSRRSRFLVIPSIPYRRVHRQSDKPAEQHVVAHLLHQLPLRTHTKKSACNNSARSSFSGAIEARPLAG